MLEVITNYPPGPIISFVLGIPLYWYGFFYVVSIITAYAIVNLTLKKINSNISNHLREILPQFTFWLFIWGIVGARLYHVLNEWQFYFENPELILRLDNGGLAIHGALIGGVLYLYYFVRKNSFYFLPTAFYSNKRVAGFLWLTDIITPALLLSQAIGRWGNYFNQELYGRPTNLPWGIFISPENRIAGFENFTHFHPTFFYEFIWNLTGAIILIFLIHKCAVKNSTFDIRHSTLSLGTGIITSLYLIITSSGRIFVELFRIDQTPDVFGIRLPLLIAISLTCLGIILITTIFVKRKV